MRKNQGLERNSGELTMNKTDKDYEKWDTKGNNEQKRQGLGKTRILRGQTNKSNEDYEKTRILKGKTSDKDYKKIG